MYHCISDIKVTCPRGRGGQLLRAIFHLLFKPTNSPFQSWFVGFFYANVLKHKKEFVHLQGGLSRSTRKRFCDSPFPPLFIESQSKNRYMNGYELSREFWSWSFENPDKVKPHHSAIYFFAIDTCNRLGWKERFGFPSQMAMEAVGIKNWRTYKNAFEDLVDWGFIDLIEKSKNQYSANIIAIVYNTKAHTKALSKAQQNHIQKQSKSTVCIDKPKNSITTNNKQESIYDFEDFWKKYDTGTRTKGSKKQAKKHWNDLSEKNKERAVQLLPEYIKAAGRDKNGNPFTKQVRYYLRDKEWEGVESEIVTAQDIPDDVKEVADRFCNELGIGSEIEQYIVDGKHRYLIGGYPYDSIRANGSHYKSFARAGDQGIREWKETFISEWEDKAKKIREKGTKV